MGYSKSRWQGKAVPNKIRYVFSVMIKGKRYQDVFEYSRNEAGLKFYEWRRDKLLESETQITQVHFFSAIDQYLEYSKLKKAPRWYDQEVAIFNKRLKPYFGDVPI
jgi:hypothetical protein